MKNAQSSQVRVCPIPAVSVNATHVLPPLLLLLRHAAIRTVHERSAYFCSCSSNAFPRPWSGVALKCTLDHIAAQV